MSSFTELKKIIAVVLLVALAVFFDWRPAGAADIDPMTQVRQSVDRIFQVLQDESLLKPEKSDERRRLVEAVVDEVFDFEEMAKSSLAKYWKKRTPEELAYFTELFADLVKQRYIGKIDSFSGQKVQYLKQDINGDRAIVMTMLLDKGTEIPIDYILVNRNDRWLAFDMKIENVSLVVNYRRDFAGIIEKEQYAGLISRMEKKVGKIKGPGLK